MAFRVRKLFGAFEEIAPCLMWVEFVVGSRPCSYEGCSPGSLVFFLPKKRTQHNSKFQFDLDRGPTGRPAIADVASSLNIIFILSKNVPGRAGC